MIGADNCVCIIVAKVLYIYMYIIPVKLYKYMQDNGSVGHDLKNSFLTVVSVFYLNCFFFVFCFCISVSTTQCNLRD